MSSPDAAMTAKVNGARRAVFQNCRRADKFREHSAGPTTSSRDTSLWPAPPFSWGFFELDPGGLRLCWRGRSGKLEDDAIHAATGIEK